MRAKVNPVQPPITKDKKIVKFYRENTLSKFIYVVLAVTVAIVIASSIIFFISPIIKKNAIIPAHVYVYGNDLSVKVQEEINQSVASNIEKIYNQLLANVQLSIALFSCALVVFAIIFGWIYFSRIRDAENLIKEIQKTPDLFFKQFYREQYNKTIANMFSSNYVKRSEAIKNLAFNPELNMEDYDVLQGVLLKELEYSASVYFYNNVYTITGVLIKLDYSRTLSLLQGLLRNNNYTPNKVLQFLAYIISDDSSETKCFIQSELLADSYIGNQIMSMLLANGLINDYSDYILEECYGTVLQTMIFYSNNAYCYIRAETFYEHLIKREDIDVYILNMVLNVFGMDITQKIKLVLHFYKGNQKKFDPAVITLINIIDINKDDKAISDLLNIAKETNCEVEINQFINRNNYYKSSFPGFFTNNIRNDDANDVRSPIAMIQNLGLYRNAEGVVIDAKEKKYDVKNYASSDFGPWLEVKAGIIIEGVFIDINQIKQQ
jgi:hypothetical protein